MAFGPAGPAKSTVGKDIGSAGGKQTLAPAFTEMAEQINWASIFRVLLFFGFLRAGLGEAIFPRGWLPSDLGRALVRWNVRQPDGRLQCRAQAPGVRPARAG